MPTYRLLSKSDHIGWQLFLLMNKFPGDLPKFRLALTMIIAHQRLRDAPIPVNEDLSAFHRQMRRTADHVISARSDDKRRRYFGQLLEELEIYQEKTLFAAPRYATLLAIGVFITIFFVLPLLYGVFTLFRKNPYKMLLRSVSTLLFSFSSSNTIAAIPLAESISRQNLGVQKRISSVSIPLMTIIGKGGSAFVSIIVLLSLYQATTGEIPGTEVIVYTALTAMLVSFISSTSLGTETALITVLTLNILGINLYGAENAIVAFMPLLSGIGSLIDTAIAMLGASVVSSAAGTDIEVPYRDTI